MLQMRWGFVVYFMDIVEVLGLNSEAASIISEYSCTLAKEATYQRFYYKI